MHSSEVYEHRDSIQRMVYLQCGKCVDAPPLLAVGVSCSTSRFCQALADHGQLQRFVASKSYVRRVGSCLALQVPVLPCSSKTVSPSSGPAC